MSGILLLLTIALFTEMCPAAELDELFISATRRPARADEISSALTLVEADAVHSQKLATDSLSSTVGVFLQQTTPGQGAAIIRGLKGSAILHLVDGMRLNNAIFRNAPTQYLALIPPGAVERVEIVRGSPTSLFGSDAVGGVIQLVTRVPRFESDTIEVRGDIFASFDTAELGKTIRGTLDAGNDTLASSLSIEYLKTGNRRTGRGNRIGPSGYSAKAARILLAATPDQDRTWLFDFHYLEQPETPRVDELVPGFGQTDPSSSEFSFAPNQRLFAHGAYSHDNGWLNLDWQLDLAWQRIVDDRVTRAYQADERRRESNRSDLSGITFSASKPTTQGSWIVGGDVYYDRVNSNRTEEDLPSGRTQVLPSRFPDRSTVRQAALFGNISHRFNSRHALNGGLRITNVAVSLPGTRISPEISINDTEFSGDLGWIFDVTKSWQLVANIGKGFRMPNVFDIGALGERPGNRFNIPNPNLTSERVLQADIGTRHMSGNLSFEMIFFRLRYKDKITSVLTGDITPDGRDIVQSSNASRAAVHGVESGATLRVTETISAHAVANYTWGEQDSAGSATEPADRIPPLNGRVQLRYNSGRRIAFDASIQFADSQNRLSARDIRDPRIDPRGTGGWAILGTRIFWDDGEGWHVTLGLDNILDKRYRVHGSGLDAVGRNVSVGIRRVWR